ncbi:MAG: outer membrane lipoprotein carrier protein LolA [Deltaproteobacteria bacterium]|nr:outer membrane lipoprotein carrier protein LolA [Deltaproteobacteria bacterium]
MRKLIFIVSSLLLFLSLSSPRGFSQMSPGDSPEETAERLQLRIDSIKSLSFTFNQQTRGEMTGRPRKGSGRAIFYKGNSKSFMRWDYISPDKQVIVSDGNVFSMYFENLNQMIVTPAENFEKELTYSFFTGNGNLKKNFHILPPNQEYSGPIENSRVIKLVPIQPHPQVQDIHLWVTESSLIRRMTIRDHFGTLTILNFSDIQVDTLAEADKKTLQSIFSFTPPDDTEIIEQ